MSKTCHHLSPVTKRAIESKKRQEMKRHTDLRAARIWNDFQGRQERPIHCKRCFAEVAGLKLRDWKLGNRDCTRQVCASCGFRAEGRFLCDAHARAHTEALCGAQMQMESVN